MRCKGPAQRSFGRLTRHVMSCGGLQDCIRWLAESAQNLSGPEWPTLDRDDVVVALLEAAPDIEDDLHTADEVLLFEALLQEAASVQLHGVGNPDEDEIVARLARFVASSRWG